jgi:type IX secretion system PorP/SprF family membrane protein
MNYIIVPVLILLNFISCNIAAQHKALYSQYMFNEIVLNPAYTGNKQVLHAALHYRNQWTNFVGTPTTQTLSIDSPLRNNKSNLGIILCHDRFGLSKETDISGNFAYRIQTSKKSKLALGILAGVVFQNYNWNGLILDDLNDNVFTTGIKNYTIPKLGVGLLYQSERFFTGISIPQIKFYNSSYSEKLIYITSGYIYELSPSMRLKPSFLLKYIASSPLQIDLNALIVYKDIFSFGTSYRSNDSFVFLTEFKKDQISLGYAYDYLNNNLKNYSKGSHEIMLRYQFLYHVKVMDPRNNR